MRPIHTILADKGSGLLDLLRSLFGVSGRHDENKDSSHYLVIIGIAVIYTLLKLSLSQIKKKKQESRTTNESDVKEENGKITTKEQK